MNREMKRKLRKILRSPTDLKVFNENKSSTIIKDGTKVKLNLERIISTNKDKDEDYLKFVENNKDVVFTVRNYVPRMKNGNTIKDLFELIEAPKYIFHLKDLIMMNKADESYVNEVYLIPNHEEVE